MDINKKNENVEKALLGLLEKYNIKPSNPFQLYVGGNADTFKLLPGYVFSEFILEKNQIPLLTWRIKRKFIELKKILADSVIENVCLFNFFSMGNKETWSLSALLYREMDLFEFIGNGKIISVQAVLNGKEAGNLILRLDNGTLCSIEVGIQMPADTAMIEKHEIIARRGVTSDMVVDTQVPQSSIYSFTSKGEKRYTDVDMELYGFDELQTDLIRAAFYVLKDPELGKKWQQQHKHLIKLVKMVYDSANKREKVNIK